MHEIRLAVPEDLPALRQLIADSVRGLSHGYYSSSQIESALRFVFGVDTQLLIDQTYYIIEAGGHELAAAGGWSRRSTLYGGDQVKRGEDSLLNPAHDPARIRAFFVHPHWARQGMARTLFNRCLSAARHEGFRTFELAATTPGEPVYTTLGFKPVEYYAVPMPDGTELPLVRMIRSIS